MSQNNNNRIVTAGGAEETLAAMDDVSYTNIGQNTYRFVRRLMQNPEHRAMIKAKAAEIRATGAYGCGT